MLVLNGLVRGLILTRATSLHGKRQHRSSPEMNMDLDLDINLADLQFFDGFGFYFSN